MSYKYLLESGSPDGYLFEDGSGVLIRDTTFTLDPANRNTNNAQLSGGNLIVTGVNQGAAQCARTIEQVDVGQKIYFEVEITTLASGGEVTLGCSDGTFVFATTLSTPAFDGKGAGLHSNDFVYPSVTNDGYSQVQGGILQCCIKRTSSTAVRVWIGHNNTWVGDPSAETGGETFTLNDSNCYGYVGVNRVDTATVRFAAASQTYAVPTSATAWDAAATADVTVALTGQSITASQGSLTAAPSVALTSQSISVARGSLTPGLSFALTGQSIIAARGSVTAGPSVSISGQSVAVAQGSIVGSLTTALSGQAITASGGTLVAGNSLSLVGQSLVAAQGSLSPAISLALTGNEVTAAQGIALPSSILALLGNDVAVAQGSVVATANNDVTVALTGVSAVLAQGSISAEGISTYLFWNPPPLIGRRLSVSRSR